MTPPTAKIDTPTDMRSPLHSIPAPPEKPSPTTIDVILGFLKAHQQERSAILTKLDAIELSVVARDHLVDRSFADGQETRQSFREHRNFVEERIGVMERKLDAFILEVRQHFGMATPMPPG